MKNLIIIPLLLCTLIPLITYSQSRGDLNNALKVYSFVSAQDKAFNIFFPDSVKDSETSILRYNYNSFFGDIKKNVIKYLSSNMKDDSLNFYLTEVDKRINNLDVSKNEKGALSAVIKQRIENLNGIPLDLRRSLIYFKYFMNPGAVVNTNFYYLYDSKDFKTQGRQFSLRVPDFFKSQTKTSSLIGNFHSDLDDRNFSVTITSLKGQYQQILKTEMDIFVKKPKEFSELIPKNAILKDVKSISGSNHNGALIEYDLTQEYLGRDFNTKQFSYCVFENNEILIFNFSYGGFANKVNYKDIEGDREKYSKLIFSILNFLKFSN